MSSDILQSDEDFRQHLADCIGFLELSADSYDRGVEGESKRLATTIRTLVHDTRSSTSLLTHLKMKGIEFLDTAHENWSDNTMPYSGLVSMQMGIGMPRYIPLLDSAKGKLVGFDAWWNGIVFVDSHKHSITRKELVLAVANQDGGAHVDKVLDEKYGKLSRHNSLGWNVSHDGKHLGPLRAPELATVRQIAHELLKALKPGYEKKPQAAGVTIGAIMHSPRILVPEPPQDENKQQSLTKPCHCGSGRKYKKCHGRVFRNK